VLGLDTHKASNSDLSAGVAKLRERGVEQTILLPEGLHIGICTLGGLEGHIRIGYFRYRGAEWTDQ
jgi:hypothetical protein